MDVPYNPLDKIHLAESIGRALVERPVHPVPPAEKFVGAGIYAIYFKGDFPLYRSISSDREDVPIYVGKAIPEGARTGGFGLASPTTTALYKRLREHARSIETVDNLDLADFGCRYLLLDEIWIPLGENYLISLHRPLWNSKDLDGFGIHDPGGGRKLQRRSRWDELHPGRRFAVDRPSADFTAEEIAARIERILAGEEEPELQTEEIPEPEG